MNRTGPRLEACNRTKAYKAELSYRTNRRVDRPGIDACTQANQEHLAAVFEIGANRQLS